MGINHITAVASALLTLQLHTSVADVVSFDWRITNIYTEYDGVYINSLGINDFTADQALIDVELGQEVEVRVTNELADPTCLHWHGLKQLGTQEMDGTSEITQCHIPPNATTIYHFIPDKAGSFWWHSHHLAQYAFGLRGPMVVRPPANQMKDWEREIDGEYIIQLADMYHRRPVAIPIYNSILINNRGRYNCTAAAKQNFTDCTDVQPLPKFHFEPGKKYLLRLISMVALAPIEFSIDEHEFRVVAADSDYLKPSESINSIFINAGQRYDIIVEAKSNVEQETIKSSYWMRAKGLHGSIWTAGTAEMAGEGFNDEGLAIVSYDDGNEAEPTTSKQNEIKTVREFDFKPDIAVQLPEVPDHRSVARFQMQNGLGYIALDGGDFHHFVHPVDPPLFSIADGLKTEQLPVDANALKIDFGKHAELVLVNVKGEQHPFHLHSHSVYIVASGTAPLEQIFNNTLPPPNLVDPMTRDVYTVEPCKLDGNGTCQEAGYVVLRFNADSPGVWVLHCHIDWHIEAGLSMMYVEGEEELQQRGAKSFSNAVLSVCGRNSRFSPT